MKKQIINSETKEILIEISLDHNDPQKWQKVLKSYEFDVPVEIVDVVEVGK